MSTKITAQIINEWVNLYENGASCRSIAKMYNVSFPTVSKNLKVRNVTVKYPIKKTKITISMINEWIELYKTGNVNCQWIANKYNVKRDTVIKYLKEFGVKVSRNVPHIVEER